MKAKNTPATYELVKLCVRAPKGQSKPSPVKSLMRPVKAYRTGPLVESYAPWIVSHTKLISKQFEKLDGVENVTPMLKGGTRKGTSDFEYFFDYTLVTPTGRFRMREGFYKI